MKTILRKTRHKTVSSEDDIKELPLSDVPSGKLSGTINFDDAPWYTMQPGEIKEGTILGIKDGVCLFLTDDFNIIKFHISPSVYAVLSKGDFSKWEFQLVFLGANVVPEFQVYSREVMVN